jgi:hypothetical protein
MEIKIECPHCQQHLAIDESWRGRSMECPTCRSSFRVPEASKTRAKSGAGKNNYIFWGIIGLLVLTSALAIFFWKHNAQKPPTYAVRNPARRIVAPTTSSSQPSPEIAAVLQRAHNAVTEDNLPLLKQLLDAHPEILNQGYYKENNTLLYSAAARGKADVVEELLNRKADVNVRNQLGRTPLFGCITSPATNEIAQMLLDHGADFTIANNSGKTPLKLAIEKNRQDIVDLLQQHGAKK